MFLTSEQRTLKSTYRTSYGFEFEYIQDLSEKVLLKKNRFIKKELKYQAIAEFVGMWTIQVYPYLNGFPGFDCIEFVEE
jgi:hypothetical protein